MTKICIDFGTPKTTFSATAMIGYEIEIIELMPIVNLMFLFLLAPFLFYFFDNFVAYY